MRYIADTIEFRIEEPAIVTLGELNGKHRGHQGLLLTVQELKSSLGYPTIIFTFDTPSLSMVSGQPQIVITTNLEEQANMGEMGVSYLVGYPFSKKTRRIKSEDFVRDILAGWMQVKVIVVGPDCSFGCKGVGDARLLEQLKEVLGYRLHVIGKKKDHLRDISSAYIQEELEKGNTEKASALLGGPCTVRGEVVHGNHVGTNILGFPTASLLPPSIKRLPRLGVYVSRILVDRTYYRGVTNIGRKPTVEGRNPVEVETYVFDAHRDLYGKVIEVRLLAFDRSERKFSSLEELRQRVEMDKVFVADYLERHPEIQVRR